VLFVDAVGVNPQILMSWLEKEIPGAWRKTDGGYLLLTEDD
jgi:hypothetical protein